MGSEMAADKLEEEQVYRGKGEIQDITMSVCMVKLMYCVKLLRFIMSKNLLKAGEDIARLFIEFR